MRLRAALRLPSAVSRNLLQLEQKGCVMDEMSDTVPRESATGSHALERRKRCRSSLWGQQEGFEGAGMEGGLRVLVAFCWRHQDANNEARCGWWY